MNSGLITFLFIEVIIMVLGVIMKPDLWVVLVLQVFIVGVWLPLIIKEEQGQ